MTFLVCLLTELLAEPDLESASVQFQAVLMFRPFCIKGIVFKHSISNSTQLAVKDLLVSSLWWHSVDSFTKTVRMALVS